MIWIAVAIVFGVAALAAIGAVLFNLIESEYDRHPGQRRAIAAVAAVLVVALTVGSVKAGIAASRQMGANGCESFAEQTGYDVRYLVTTWADGGTCYVLFGGNWVPKGQLWAELGGGS